MQPRYVLTVAVLAVLAAGPLAAAGPASFEPESAQKASEKPQVSVDVARSLAISRDGKPVVAGLSRKGGLYTWAVARYSANGKLDPSFGSGGRVLTQFGSGTAYAVATRADGKLLVAGAGGVDKNGDTGFALARYTVRGRLDPTFGRNGRVLTAFAKIPGDKFSLARVIAVALQPDGKIVAAGWSGGVNFRDFALARYTARGELDPSFGQGGKVVTDFGSARSHQAQLAAAALQPDGKIVAVGTILLPGRGAVAVARFTTRGELDPGFGQGGRVVTEVGSWSDASSVAVQPDGSIVVGGSPFASGSRFALLRYTAEGTLDPSFGTGGEVITDVDSGHSCDPGGACKSESLRGVALEPDGKLVAAGSISGPADEGAVSFALARYLENGSLDSSFGQGGAVLTDFPAGAGLNAVAVQADGRIVAAGSSHGDFALARFIGSGSLDPSFGSGGRLVTAFGPAWKTKLASLSATRVSGGVLVRWRTASEFDARGFYVLREQKGVRLPSNRALIRAKGAGLAASYSFRERVARHTARYWLQEVTVDGNLRSLGSVAVRR